MLALVEPFGTGKMTIIGLISRLYDPSVNLVRVGTKSICVR